MSQLSSSVLAIPTRFPVFDELMHFVLDQQVVANVLFAVGQLTDAVRDHRSGDHGEQTGEDDHTDVGMTAEPDRRAGQHQQQAQYLGLGGRVHPRQRVGEAEHTDRGGQRKRRAAEHQYGCDDVQHIHRNLLAARGLSVSGTLNRATLTDPTKLINASAVKPYVTVVSRLKAAQVPTAHIVTATRVSNATSRSSVPGPASSRNMVVTAAAVSITAAMTQTVVMRDPPSLLACKSCASPIPSRPPMLFALERGHQ